MREWQIYTLGGLLTTACFFAMSPANAAVTNRDVVHTEHGQILTNTFGNCVRTVWQSGENECAPPAPPAPPQAAVVAPTPPPALTTEQRTVYFEFDEAGITADSQQKLDHLSNVLKQSPKVIGADIVGYADEIGTNDYNRVLSERRAKAVQQYLSQRGYMNTTLAETRGLGESGSVTQCDSITNREAKIACLGQDRRVEVEVRMQQPVASSNTPATYR